MSPRCVPGPINSATIRWRDPATTQQGRLIGDVYPHELGGLTELSDSDDKGLAVCILNDPGTIEPAPNQDPGLARTPTGKLYAPLPTKKRRVIPGATRTGVVTGQEMLFDNSIELDNTAGNETACWEVCVDICGGVIDNPTTGTGTVSIPPNTTTINVPPDGGLIDISHSHGSVSITPPTPPSVTMSLSVNGQTCDYMRNDSIGAGRYCFFVEVPSNTVLNLPITADLSVGASHDPFTASTGTFTVTWCPIGCPEDC